MQQITDLYISNDGKFKGTSEEVKEYEDRIENEKKFKDEKDKKLKAIAKKVDEVAKLIDEYRNTYNDIPFIITDLRKDEENTDFNFFP